MWIVWAGSISIISSIPLAWWALRSGQDQRRGVPNLSDQASGLRDINLNRSVLDRILAPLVSGLGGRVLRFTPAGWKAAKATALAKAGLLGRVSAEHVLGAKLVMPILILLVFGFRFIATPTFSSFLLLLTMLVSGFVAPDLLVKAAADRRADEITRLLPDMLDQLTISVEAGLGFEAALSRMVAADENALTTEFAQMLRDVRLGTSRGDALTDLADRTQADDVRTMVLSLRQAETLGVPLARSLRTLSGEMRDKRRLRAEEKANQLPVKLIFPLGLCILPAMFIVLLGPAMLSFRGTF